MKCSHERSARLMEYAEGNLPPSEAADLEGHLSSCGYCRGELESWQRLEARLRDLPLVAEPAGFKAAVMSRVVAEPRRAPVPVAYRPVDPVAALALGAIVVGLGTFLSGGGDVAGWEWRFDLDYWQGLLNGAANTVLGLAEAAAGILLTNLAQAALSGLMESAPVLMAALLLALLALGPAEIARAFGPQRTASE